MKEARIDLLQEWKQENLGRGIRFSYPEPEEARGFYPCGFVRKNDSAADLTGWHGLFLALREKGGRTPEERERQPEQDWKLYVTVFFAEENPLKIQIPVLWRNGEAFVEIPFTRFPQELARGNRWEFVTAVEIGWHCGDVELTECTVRRRPGIYIHMPVKGRSGSVGEHIYYRGAVYNCASESLSVTTEQVFEGWESLMAVICLGQRAEEAGAAAIEESSENHTVLAPGESVPFAVSVTIHDDMVPGGHENTLVRVYGQGGMTSCQDSIELKTLCRLPHPYLYHNAAGWKMTMENIKRYEPYSGDYQKYRKEADSWIVTDPLEERPFCYETAAESAVMSAAYLYALTGERGYAEKLADFFRRFSNPTDGYPARKRGCSQSYVQEGHFFKHLAVSYDIIYDSGALTREDKAAMERCFRLYMEMLDVHILDGHISNWILSELQGALFAALALQDMERALRFAFGRGGIFEQFRYGIFNDGWWHECSVGYNTWVSSIMLHTVHALLPFGYNLVYTYFRVPFNKEVRSTYQGKAPAVPFGMYNQKWGGNRKSAVCIKDMFDATLPFLDYRGVLFGIADSDEKKLSGVHFGSTYDLAYHYYKDDRYLPVIAKNECDAVFGNPETHMRALKKDADMLPVGNACADNIGLAMLRSRKPGREQREQIQAVLRYGSHGNAHGHFDITDLLSVMRYGRSFFNPENCWWGYAHFMYKFYVQCSLTKNMVVVDEKMQIPADSRKILWHSEEGLQAAGIEVRTRWSYPPYGGMVYTQDGQTATKEELRKRCKMNGCFLPIVEGEGSPGYGELTGFTEPILQRRIMAVTDDYIVLFDYVEGEQEHCYDSLMQIKGFLGIEGADVRQTHHTEQMNTNPVSDAQFITDCNWYEAKGGSVARFRTVFTEEHAGERLVCDRSNYNEPGILNMDVHTAWPKQTQQMVGRVAVYDGWAADGNGYTIPLSYRVDLDGTEADSGAFDGWILGRGEVSLDVKGASQAVLSLKQGIMHNETGNPVKTPQGVFWGEICLELEDGTVLNLGQSLKRIEEQRTGEEIGFGGRWPAERVRMENVDMGYGIGKDYKGGRVTIVGTEYPYALGASPVDHEKESRILLNLDGLGAVKLSACVGVDAFPGDEWQKRKTYAVRTHGKVGRFVTVIEPYEEEAVIVQVDAGGPDKVQVALKDGRVQEITLTGIRENNPQVTARLVSAIGQEGDRSVK
ncbi:MAG: hypothetical protein NC341_09555 [Blautia sp.]|nr:hypothetical protein [Blautia sp.]MCM1201416.1 hypothetical protein [Bacteroides fragilis]